MLSAKLGPQGHHKNVQRHRKVIDNGIAVPVVVVLILVLYYIYRNTSAFIALSGSMRAHQSSGCELYPTDCITTAPFIFNALHSLLKQWPNTYAGNGHSIVPARIPANTPLYHVKQWPQGIPGRMSKPTFFGFDPEMGIGLRATTAPTHIHTYLTTRPLRMLYLDGQSAVLTTLGTLDAQTALLRSYINPNPDMDFIYDDHARGNELCALAAKLQLHGIVRMDAGFEAIVCDFEAAGVVEAVVANVTVPGKGGSRRDSEDLPDDPTRSPPEGNGDMYAERYGWEWVRSGTWHYGGYGAAGDENDRESRVQLETCGMLSFYSPLLRSLSGKHHGFNVDGRSYPTFESGWGLRRGHRLLGISREDARMAGEWVREVSSTFRARLDGVSFFSPSIWFGEKDVTCSGINWQAITETIVSQHKGRILEISAALSRQRDGMLSTSDLFEHVRGLSHAALQPFVQYPTNEARTVEDIKRLTLDRCSNLYTKYVPAGTYNRFEALLKDSIQLVVGRICKYEWEAFEWSERHSTDLLRHPHGQPESEGNETTRQGEDVIKPPDETIRTFMETTKTFIEWIGWDLWTRCPEPCAWNELCYIPMWPIIYAPGATQLGGPYGDDETHLSVQEREEFWRPKCLSMKEFDAGGWRLIR